MIPRQISTEALRDLAQSHGVCIRPIVHQVLDTVTGQVRAVSTPCGATLASKCPPCAHRNRVLRMQQCREGWHLEEEPADPEPEPDPGPDDDDDDPDPDDPPARRVRSTRRRQDVPDLPRLPVEKRTVGKAFTTPAGKTYRPSMFVTLTLPSYGRVRPDGTPFDPATYNYRRAAMDALHFPKLLDRFWQNLRRATGYQVQYFAAVESQRRLAPHVHTAIRGAIPRELLRQVASGTYHQVWWPRCDEVSYSNDRLPEWAEEVGYVDPEIGEPLPTWLEALDRLEEGDDARPSHTLRLGRQLDIQGIIAEEGDADRRVAYLTKYLSKSFGEAFGDQDDITRRQRVHLDRLHREVRWLPCSSRCWNWLRYGVQPDGAKFGMVPGECPNKAHDAEHLGCGGRRVLVSRKWTGKTLTDHRADRAEVVRQTLLAAGMDVPEVDRLAVTVQRDDGQPRYEWKIWNAHEATTPIYRQVLTRSIAERLRWKRQYDAAKKARATPANGPPRPPDNQPDLVRDGGCQG